MNVRKKIQKHYGRVNAIYSTLEMNTELDEAPDTSENLIPLSSYRLSDDEHRRAFLHHVYWIGETTLFEAVSHVWVSLAEPCEARCTLMGLLSGSGGTGKKALVLTLQKFLAEALAVDNPLPNRADYLSLDAWNEDAMAAFEADRREVADLCTRYSAILNGCSPEPEQPSTSVIIGPWLTDPRNG